jgi:hypothetical protein
MSTDGSERQLKQNDAHSNTQVSLEQNSSAVKLANMTPT